MPEGEHLVPLGKTTRFAKGATLRSSPGLPSFTVEAAEALAQEGSGRNHRPPDALPWDRDQVLSSVEKTRRLLVVQEAVSVAGFGAEIAASVAEALHPLLATGEASWRAACQFPIADAGKPGEGDSRGHRSNSQVWLTPAAA